MAHSGRQLFLDTMAGRPTPRRPLWIMRQAGRYLPEYRALRARHSFEELSRDPALAAAVTLQPLARFDLDCAIIFADLMSPIPALGLDVAFNPGPTLATPVRTAADVARLRTPSRDEIAPEVTGALRAVKREIGDRRALLGFAGSPWSLAAYVVEGKGGSGFPTLRAMAHRDPAVLTALMTRLTDLVIEYVAAQVAAGADAVQIFDTWAGVLSLESWNALVRPHLARILEATRTLGVPRILFVQDASHLVAAYAALPSEALAVDWREDLGALRRILGPQKVLQGNLDPALMSAGPAPTHVAAEQLLRRVPRGGHIVNLGHGIMPDGQIDAVQALIDVVHAEAS